MLCLYRGVVAFLLKSHHHRSVQRSVFGVVRRNCSCSANNSAYCYTFLRSVVCLSVCLSCVTFLLRSTDLDAIRQVHLHRPMTFCVRWGSLTIQGKGRFGVEPSAKTCSQNFIVWRVQADSDSAFCQISLVLVLVLRPGTESSPGETETLGFHHMIVEIPLERRHQRGVPT